MNYAARNIAENLTRNKLQEVAKAGQAQGLWSIAKFNTVGDGSAADMWQYAQLVTPEGHTYSLTGGGYTKPTALHMSLTEHTQGAHRITPRDCYGMQTVDANVSAERDTAAILKSFQKRVINEPVNIACASAMLARLAAYNSGAAALREQIAKVEKLGYVFRNVKESDAHSATGCSTTGTNRPQVTVYANGNVSFDASTTVDNLAVALAAL